MKSPNGLIDHAGEILRTEIDRIFDTHEQAATRLHTSKQQLSMVINGHRAITPVLALHLEECTQKPANFWLALQNERALAKKSPMQIEAREDAQNERTHEQKNFLRSLNAIGSRILVDSQIEGCINNDLLSIKPYNDANLQPASYDLSIGNLLVTSPDGVNTSDEGQDAKKGIEIHPGSKVCLMTREYLVLTPHIVGRLGAMTKWVQVGFFYSHGAQVDPGYTGKLYFMLRHLGNQTVTLRFGDPILTIEFSFLPQAARKRPPLGRDDFSDSEKEALSLSGDNNGIRRPSPAATQLRQIADAIEASMSGRQINL